MKLSLLDITKQRNLIAGTFDSKSTTRVHYNENNKMKTTHLQLPFIVSTQYKYVNMTVKHQFNGELVKRPSASKIYK